MVFISSYWNNLQNNVSNWDCKKTFLFAARAESRQRCGLKKMVPLPSEPIYFYLSPDIWPGMNRGPGMQVIFNRLSLSAAVCLGKQLSVWAATFPFARVSRHLTIPLAPGSNHIITSLSNSPPCCPEMSSKCPGLKVKKLKLRRRVIPISSKFVLLTIWLFKGFWSKAINPLLELGRTQARDCWINMWKPDWRRR